MSLQEEHTIKITFNIRVYTEQDFEANKWKVVKEKILKLDKTNEEETIPYIQQIIDLLANVQQAQSIPKFFQTEAIQNFFLNDFFLNISKNLISTKQFEIPVVLEMSNHILEQIVLLFRRLISEDHIKMCETFRTIMDPARSYFKFNNIDTDNTSPPKFGFVRQHNLDDISWAKSLKESDELDVIKYDNQYRRMCWSRGVVVNSLENHIKISFKNEHSTFDSWIERNSFDIAPLGTKCKDFEWRLALSKNDLIDASDTSNVWYNSTILDKREIVQDQKTIYQLQIGYRIYGEGEKLDINGNKFQGWSARYDEWISCTSPRISKLNSQAKKLYIAPSNTLNEDSAVDDSNDQIYIEEEETKKYAIVRGHLHKNKVIVKIINKFGEAGGFDNFLERLLDTQRWCSIDFLSNFMVALGNINPYLFKGFTKNYIPKLKQAIFQNIISSPDANIRNFSTEKIQNIIQSLEDLLKRVYSIPEKNEFIEQFSLDIALLNFNSDFLERKLQGLKSLTEIVKNIKFGQYKSLQFSDIINKIQQDQVFEKIFGVRGHNQLIPRSLDFLKYLVNENLLNEQNLDIIWSATRNGHMESKLNTYKVISELSIGLKSDYTNYFLDKIKEIEPENFISEELDLVYDLSRYTSKGASITTKTCLFYWNIICNPNQYQKDLVETALNKFCDLMRNQDMRDARFDVINNCVDNIAQCVAVLSSIKILKKIIDFYPSSPQTNEKFTQAGIVEYICKERDIITIVLKDLAKFKQSIRQLLIDTNKIVVNEGVIDSLIYAEKTGYINHISERLSFLQYIFINGGLSVKLTYELLCQLWDSVIINPLIETEKDVMYKWFKEASESKSKFPMTTEDLIRFFKEKMSIGTDISSMTQEGFNCFQSLFCLINEKLNKIQKSQNSNNIQQHYSRGNFSIGFNYDENKPKVQEFEYVVMVHPAELEGIESLWNLIVNTSQEKVVEKAVDFLNQLYFCLDQEQSKEIYNIRQQFLEKCTFLLKQTLEHKEEYKQNELSQKVIRCLNLIRSILDESEKKGIGKLKSHSALTRGELMNINVINELTSGIDVPKKIELKLYSNTTVHELRYKIGQVAKVTWDQVKLVRSLTSQEIKDNENGKTIADIRIRSGESLRAQNRPTPPIAQVPLVMPDNTINPLLILVFKRWFNEYSSDNKMSPELCANFIHSCTGDYCKAEDRRVKDIFSKWDDDKDGFLTEENFVNFYSQASQERKSVVWSNLHAHRYRNDLKQADEVEIEKIDVTKLPRYIITTNHEYFKLLFSLLDYGGKVAIEVWKVLSRLPTSPDTYKSLVQLNGVRNSEIRNWDEIIDSNSKYKLLYSLYVLEYFMEEDESENEVNEQNDEISIEQIFEHDKQLDEYRRNWRADFIIYGGFEHLFKIFTQFTNKENQQLNIFDKNILSFILKIFKNYLIATYASSVQYLYFTTTFIRFFHLNLNSISDYIDYDIKKISKHKDYLHQDSIRSTTENPGTFSRKGSELIQNKKSTEDSLKIKLEEPQDFRALVERLQGQLGQQVLTTINVREFIKYIITLANDILNKQSDFEMEDRLIIEYSLQILVGSLLYNKSMVDEFLNGQLGTESVQTCQFILEGLFCIKSFNVRKYFTNAFYLLLKESQEELNFKPNKLVIKMLINNIPSSKESSRSDCPQFFDLLCKLIQETYEKNQSHQDQDTLNFDDLFNKITHRILTHHSIETRNTQKSDKILIGLLNLCEKIILVQPQLKLNNNNNNDNLKDKNFLIELFKTCLFDISDTKLKLNDFTDNEDTRAIERDYVKCKSSDSRNSAYRILKMMCVQCPPNIQSLIQHGFLPLMKRLPQISTWNYMPKLDTKSSQGYVGLKNLGCICYMNAMLQQFFMTPTFRYAILMADDKKSENLVLKDNKYWVDDNVFHQMQKMFGFLLLNDRSDYNPHEFCFSFKDYAGQPVNVSIQQDTQEFLNMIFDKIDNALKPTPFKYILDSVYGGRTCTQILCSGCGTVKNRIENFYNLSVEVRNMKNIYESFDKFITGEIISDYFCETCNKKVDTTKRCCISTLPNVLIVHLQRIVFNLDTFQNEKINSRLEFPFELNVEPYTLEGITWRDKQKEQAAKATKQENSETKDFENEDITVSSSDIDKSQNQLSSNEMQSPYEQHGQEYYEYKLVGVVVHTGTAEFGHYYSYINVNHGNRDPKAIEKWCEFNDSMVREFNPQNIENECFGGAGSESMDDWGWGRVGRENSKNAYILVYERKVKEPVRLLIHNEQDKADLDRVLHLDKSIVNGDILIKEFKTEQGSTTDNTNNSSNEYGIEVDYYQIRKFVPENVYAKIWEDNHKFMLERHIYNEDFFKFIKDIGSCIDIPENQYLIYSDYQLLPQESVQVFRNLTKIFSKIIIELLARAHDNECIGELSQKLRQIISLCPEYALEFFDQNIMQNLKIILEMIITCPDKLVRNYISKIVLHTINLLIYFYDIDLNPQIHQQLTDDQINSEPKTQAESLIIQFLDQLLVLLPTDVAKNWQKFQQYFEFWRDFSNQGEIQMNFMFKKGIFTIFVDFFLEKKSPLIGFSEKKHTIGSNFNQPVFDPLIQTVHLMVIRINIQNDNNIPSNTLYQDKQIYELTENDRKLIYCSDFYERAIREGYDYQSVGMIIQHLCLENEQLSQAISIIILKGLSKSNHDQIKPYLEAMSYMLNLKDSLTDKRYEWILGFPQPLVSAKLNELDNFGCYLHNFLDEQVVTYESTLCIEGANSILNLILINRKRWENLCLINLRQILILCEINDKIFDYVSSLPPPNYLCANFSDWIRPFLENYISEAAKFLYAGFPKEEVGKETLRKFEIFESRFNAKLQDQLQLNETKDSQVIQGIIKPYIIGQTIQEDKLFEKVIYQNQIGEEVSLIGLEASVYLTDSLPNNTTNIAFPQDIIRDNMILNSSIPEDSTCGYFIQPRTYQFNSNLNSQQKYSTSNRNKQGNDIQIELHEIGYDSNNGTQANSTDLEASSNITSTQPKIDTYSMSYFQDNFIRRFIIDNQTNQLVHVSFQLIQTNESDLELNVRIPKSVLNVVVKPHIKTQIFVMSKILPLKNWGNYDYVVNCSLQEQEEIQFQNNNNNNDMQKKLDLVMFPEVSNDEVYNGKQCYNCYTYNSPKAFQCKLCETDLHWIN